MVPYFFGDLIIGQSYLQMLNELSPEIKGHLFKVISSFFQIQLFMSFYIECELCNFIQSNRLVNGMDFKLSKKIKIFFENNK